VRFPDSFLFGASTAAYQIEGAFDEDGRGRSIWDVFSHTAGKVEGGDNGDRACDHYHRWHEDVRLLAGAHLDAYRFSIAWPRVVPDGRGAVNGRGIDFYDRLVDGLLEAGVEPWPCLYHWDLPQALEDRGGWPARDTVWRFADYATKVVGRLGDRIRHLVLLNEPSIAAVFGHLLGIHAPGTRNVGACFAAMHHMNLATGLAAQAIRAARQGIELGSALALNWIEPATDRDEDIEAAQRLDAIFHGAFLEPPMHGRYPEIVEHRLSQWVQDGDLDVSAGAFDFLGVNYYTRQLVAHRGGSRLFDCWIADPPERAKKTEMGWEVYPDGLRLRLLALHRAFPKLPLHVTENGAAFDDRAEPSGWVDDTDRIAYLEEHLGRCLEAVEKGVDLRGYFVWSILDNFEWAEGYRKRFGLVRVDYETGARTPKASYAWFAKVAETREIGG
jgi:beta-glucosidase